MKRKKDKFSGMEISRQRRYQLRHAEAGLCLRCSRKAVLGQLCLNHAVSTRERARAKHGCKKRINARSYKMEAENPPEFIRACGECVCESCGKTYFRHPKVNGYPFLVQACDGRKLKL